MYGPATLCLKNRTTAADLKGMRIGPLLRGRLSEETEGFTLVEMVVAITILAGVFVALAGVLVNMLAVTLQSRQNQQAGDLISEVIENARESSYAAIALVDDPADFSGGEISGTSPNYTFDPDGSGPLGDEDVVLAGGSGFDHRRSETRNGTDFTIRTYVTQIVAPVDASNPASPVAEYKRVLVRASWERGRRTYTREADTLVALTRRGLPLPNFEFGEPDDVSVAAGPGGPEIVVTGVITNRGARDWWNFDLLTGSTRPSWAGDATIYLDDGDGVLELTDTELDDTDGDGAIDTGAIETDDFANLLFTVDLPAGETSGTDLVLRVTATSGAQPDLDGASKSVDYTVDVAGTPPPCTTCSDVTLHLGKSTTPNRWFLTENPPTATTAISDGGDAGSWTYAGPSTVCTRYGGPLTTSQLRVTLFGSGTYNVVIEKHAGGPNWTVVASLTGVPAGTQTGVTVTTEFQLNQNQKLRLRKTSGGNVDYGSTSRDSMVILPKVGTC